jgi:hypothetical protein
MRREVKQADGQEPVDASRIVFWHSLAVTADERIADVRHLIRPVAALQLPRGTMRKKVPQVLRGVSAMSLIEIQHPDVPRPGGPGWAEITMNAHRDIVLA